MLLSPQEDLLLRVSVSISACPSGQRYGITNYYNSLPLEFRSSVAQLCAPEQKINDLIERTIQNVMNETFGDTEFWMSLLKISNVSQLTHQILFLKNRLFNQLGLEHTLTFDAHSGTLYDSLLEMPLIDLLKAYFAICTVDKVIARLKRNAEEALQKKHVGYMDIVFYLEREGEKLSKEMIFKYFIFDEEYKPLSITQEGAIKLITSSKYIV